MSGDRADRDTDAVTLGGARTPGRARVKGFGTPRVWDKRKGYGTTGATLVYTGEDLAKGSIEVALWDAPGTGHWVDWEAFAKRVLVKEPKGKAKPLSITHWSLTMPPCNVTSVVVEDVTQFDYDSGEDLWKCEIKLQAYRAPTPAVAKAKGSANTSGVGTRHVETAQDAADVEINRLLSQFNSELAK